MLQAGDCVGEFTVVRLIGRGGMAEIYLAHQPALDREVALKVLPADKKTEFPARRAFTREGRAQARIRHPGVARILTSGCTPGQTLYHSMELIEGVNLSQLMAEVHRLDQDNTAAPNQLPIGPFPTEVVQAYRQDRQEFVRQAGIAIAEALVAVHDANVLHHDIKVGNVMVDGKGAFYLLDFGIAQFLDEKPISTRRHGSLAAMSPEAAQGEAVDVRSDLFSLGVLLYELLTGGDSPYDVARSDREAVLEAVKAGKMRPIVEAVPDVSSHLAFVIEKATQLNPRHRFQTADEMLAALRACDDSPTVPLPPSPRAPVSGWWVVLAASVLLTFGTTLLGAHFLKPNVADHSHERPGDQPTLPAEPFLPRPGPTLSFSKPATFDTWISPNGKHVVTASGNLISLTHPIELTLWDAGTGKPLRSLQGHTGRVWTVGFSPDGQRIATGGGSFGKPGELMVWDIATGDRLLNLVTPGPYIRYLTYSRDGQFLAYCNVAFQTVVIDARDGKEVWNHTWGEDVHSVAFSHDGF